MIRIQHAARHLSKGTLWNRLKQEWHGYLRDRRATWWQSRIGRLEYVETPIETGARMRLFFDSQLCREVYCGGFEIAERKFTQAFLLPGDIYVDVGANVGLFTLLAACKVGDLGLVYAFEPSTRTFDRLLTNVLLNQLRNVSCLQLALSDDNGTHELNERLDGYDAWSSLARPVAGDKFAPHLVNTVRWDDFAREHGLLGQITMMKIDVEGWETHVLSGGINAFERPDAPVLQMEFTDEAAMSAGSSCHALYRALERLGYQMFTYNPANRRLIPDPPRASYPYVNLIASKRPDEIRFRLETSS
jgi:FkbM family methyltransferase